MKRRDWSDELFALQVLAVALVILAIYGAVMYCIVMDTP